MADRLHTLMEMHSADMSDSFITYALAKEYESHEQLDSALEIYLQLRESDPMYVGLYYHLGKLYENLEKPELALEAYSHGIEVGKKQSDFHAISELNNAKTNLEMEL